MSKKEQVEGKEKIVLDIRSVLTQLSIDQEHCLFLQELLTKKEGEASSLR